jgi:hypothetical protein
MLRDYILRTENKNILNKYSLKKLRQEFPSEKNVQALIDVNLESIIDTLFETKTYEKWQLTSENVAELNLIIFAKLKESIRKSIQGRDHDSTSAEKTIDEMLQSKRISHDEPRESSTFERISLH